MNFKLLFYTLSIGFVFNACIAPSMMTINQETVDAKYTQTYDADIETMLLVVKESVADLGWVQLEEHRNVLKRLKSGQQMWKVETKKAFYAKSDYKYSWGAVAPKTVVDDLIFLKIRTPMSLTSYGAKLYIGISLKKNIVTVKYSGSTNQTKERDKLMAYLTQISQKVEQKVNLLK